MAAALVLLLLYATSRAWYLFWRYSEHHLTSLQESVTHPFCPWCLQMSREEEERFLVQSSSYLAKVVLDSIGELFESADSIKQWLAMCARIVSGFLCCCLTGAVCVPVRHSRALPYVCTVVLGIRRAFVCIVLPFPPRRLHFRTNPWLGSRLSACL